MPGADQALIEQAQPPVPEKAAEKPADPKPEEKPEEKKDEPKPEEPKKEEPKKPLQRLPVLPPLGAAGPPTVKGRDVQSDDHFVPIPDRWRVGFPDWPRYRSGLGAPSTRGRWLNPYTQNVLKGDYPIRGNRTFLDLSLSSETLVDYRQVAVPSNVSSSGPGRYPFFGDGDILIADETLLLSAEIFSGQTSFRPKDWSVRVTPVFNVNHLRGRETGLPAVDVREGTSRTNTWIGFQEFFGEYKIADLSPNFDFLSVRAGIQGFTSDFRGFLFVDNQPGIRFFGNADSNRYQYNLAYFRPLEKDTFSRLNRSFKVREQNIFIANLFRQDFPRPGYTSQLLFAHNHDQPSRHYNRLGFQTRPSLVGTAQEHAIHSSYIGTTGDGHFGRINVSHAFIQAFGYDTRNPISRRSQRINAQMGALELSYDKDWQRFRTSFFYASGDGNPLDGRARGFDAITDNPIFAGGGFSFWQASRIPLTGAGLDLVSDSSLLPSLRSGKFEGQSNFVNPGVMIVNMGYDADLTPKWRMSLNANWLQFHKTQALELILNQGKINRGIGMDYSLGFRHRPFLNDNVIFTFGTSALVPHNGLKDILDGRTLFSGFAKLTLQY